MGGKFRLSGGDGQWSVEEQGDGLWIHMEKKDDGRGLYKGYLDGGGGRYVLGALMPEGGRLVLKRRILRRELERRGIWPIGGGGVMLAYATSSARPRGQTGVAVPKTWHREHSPRRWVGDAIVARCVQDIPCVLSRSREGGVQLAVPWQSDGAFALPPIFCLAQVEMLEGMPYVVFSFDKEGNPVLQSSLE